MPFSTLQDASKARLRDSFALISRTEGGLGMRFYDRLLEVAPTMRHLFTAQQSVQAHRFEQTLVAAIDNLETPEAVDAALQELGARHAGYGVRPGHYVIVGEVLIDTLERVLGSFMDADTRADWVRLYGRIVASMLAGAQSAVPVGAAYRAWTEVSPQSPGAVGWQRMQAIARGVERRLGQSV